MAISKLVGKWIADPESLSHGEMDNSSLEFRENGRLIYTIHEPEKDQKIFLDYEINGAQLITDQPSTLQSQKETTEFFFNSEGKLVLAYEDSWSIYIKSA